MGLVVNREQVVGAILPSKHKQEVERDQVASTESLCVLINCYPSECQQHNSNQAHRLHLPPHCIHQHPDKQSLFLMHTCWTLTSILKTCYIHRRSGRWAVDCTYRSFVCRWWRGRRDEETMGFLPVQKMNILQQVLCNLQGLNAGSEDCHCLRSNMAKLRSRMLL